MISNVEWNYLAVVLRLGCARFGFPRFRAAHRDHLFHVSGCGLPAVFAVRETQPHTRHEIEILLRNVSILLVNAYVLLYSTTQQKSRILEKRSHRIGKFTIILCPDNRLKPGSEMAKKRGKGDVNEVEMVA